MTPSERLAKLNDNRQSLIEKYKAKRHARRSTDSVSRDLIKVTCKVLKFERKAERAGS
jgi:hypothetical protein